MVNFKKVGIRIQGRKVAEELLPLIELPEEMPEEFTEALLERLAEGLPKPTPRVKGTDKPIPVSRLGNTQLDFGKHKGKSFDSTPIEYLQWLYTEQETFNRQLKNYLNHPDLEQYRRGLNE